MPQKVAALYQFTPLPDFRELRDPLLALCEALDLNGTILLASEGINGTVAGAPAAIDALLDALVDGPLFGGRLDKLELKVSTAAEKPFGRLKVRLKKEIVAFGDARAAPSVQSAAEVAPADWNALIARPDVTVVDVRNAFEVAMGRFEGALDPATVRFSAFRTFADGPLAAVKGGLVALYCTGGIRCEKAGAYLKARGFENVRTLKGGILRYLEEVPAAESRWRGGCFVFDGRVALGHGLQELPGVERADVVARREALSDA